MRGRTGLAVLVMSSVLCAPLMAQQRHVVSPDQMRQAVAAQAKVDQQHRDAVLTMLERPQARDVASRLGLTLTQAESAVAALSGDELAGLAASARAADEQLAGGSTIVISTTTLLLIIIIVILLAK